MCVDEPKLEAKNVLPPLAAVTADTAYVRFHGRNAATWKMRAWAPPLPGSSTYTPTEELAEWVEPIRGLAKQTSTTYVMFNNCFGDYAPQNAQADAHAVRPLRQPPTRPPQLAPLLP